MRDLYLIGSGSALMLTSAAMLYIAYVYMDYCPTDIALTYFIVIDVILAILILIFALIMISEGLSQ